MLMPALHRAVSLLFVMCLCSSALFAQDSGAADDEGASDVERRVDEIEERAEEFARDVDADPRAQEAAAGILKPLYQLAENLKHPAVHWAAFAVMVAGVVSFGLQLVLAKLVVLTRMGFSFTEILSDALGLLISLIGLVVLTQATAENSTFARSAFAVLSAALAGILFGFVFYVWGQKHEIQAVEGRRLAALRKDAEAKK
jgi:hypothetical protein